MPEVPEDELKRMAQAIDEGLEPRVRIDAELSDEAVVKVHDILVAVANDLDQQAGVEASWPLVRVIDVLSQARSRS
jgi:hypothetical protein